MNASEVRQVGVDGHNMAVQYGVRERDGVPEHVISVPGTDIVVTAPSEEAAFAAVSHEIREVALARRAESERLEREAQGGARNIEVDGQAAQVVLNGKTGGTTKADREAEELRLIDAPLEELARTLAALDLEAEPHTKQKNLAENALNKITQRRKVIIAELGRRGHKIIERDLGKNEFDMR